MKNPLAVTSGQANYGICFMHSMLTLAMVIGKTDPVTLGLSKTWLIDVLRNLSTSFNIQLSDTKDIEEGAYLIGKSSGIFLAIEIISEQGIW